MDENFYSYDGYLYESGLIPFRDFPSRSPLMILLAAGVLRIGGDFITLRLLVVLVAVSTGFLIYHTAKLLSGERTGAIASAIFFLSPYSIRYGYTFMTQPFEAFGLGLAFYFIIRWLHDQKSSIEKMGVEKSGSRGWSSKDSHDSEGSKTDCTLSGTSVKDPLAHQRNSFLNALKQHRYLFLSGIIISLSVFIRRSALILFPVGILIILSSYLMTREGYLIKEHFIKQYSKNAQWRTPFMVFTTGFTMILIPGMVIFAFITGLSYTAYFFYSDYFDAHTSLIGNLSFSFTAYDTRGYFFVSSALVFITLILWKGSRYILLRIGFREREMRYAEVVIKLMLLMGWYLAAYTLLGNNYTDAGNGWITGSIMLMILTSAFLAEVFLPIDSAIRSNARRLPVPMLLAIIAGSCLIYTARGEFYLVLNAIILFNIVAIALLFLTGFHNQISFRKNNGNGYYSPILVTGIFFSCMLAFYIMFRIIIPYYYDILFPLCIITAILLEAIAKYEPSIDWKNLVGATKTLFIATLILSVPVTIAHYTYQDVKMNRTEIDDINDCVEYLKDHAEPQEEIFTAKAVIALQADLRIIFNIVRPAPYLEKNDDILDRFDYPDVSVIITYLETYETRFVIMEWVMETYFLETYPEMDDYIESHYHPAEEFDSIEVWIRNDSTT